MLNILHIITGLDVGGAEKVVFNLISGTPYKVKNYVVFLKKDEMGLVGEFEKEGVSPLCLDIHSNPMYVISKVWGLCNVIKLNKIKVIHSHLFHALVVSCLIKIFIPKIKVIFTPHSINIGSHFRKVVLYILRPFRDVDIIFSEHQKKKYIKNNYQIIKNGIDLNNLSYKNGYEKSNKFTFINVGNLREPKNQTQLIDFIYQLRNYDIELKIIGKGELKSDLYKKISELELSDKVHLLGFRNDVYQLLSNAQVFVLPSLWEGMPMAILEAGAAGLPIITTPVGSITSIINETNGYLADLESFKDTMEYVYHNYSEALNKGKRLKKEIYEKYTKERMTKDHLNLYKRIQ